MKVQSMNDKTQVLFRRTWAPLIQFSVLIAFLSALPLMYILYQAARANPGIWQRLFNTKIPILLFNTLALALATALIASIIALVLAWVIVKTDVPFKRILNWLPVMPLAIPPYIAAFTYIVILGPAGVVPTAISKVLNIPLSQLKFNYIYSFWGVALIFAFFTYPYIYILAANALKNIDGNLEEMASSSGLSGLKTFCKVTLPLITPSIFSGALLVIMYVLADFGAIAMLRYESFTRAIYLQLTGRYDRPAAAVLSSVLIAVIFAFLWFDNHLRNRRNLFAVNSSAKSCKIINLGQWKLPVLLLIISIMTITLMIPVGTLIAWSIKGVKSGVITSQLVQYVSNSFFLAATTASVVSLIALPLAYVNTRYKNKLYQIISKLSYTGYTLPGIITALGTVFVFSNYLPFLYRTIFCLVAAYTIKLLPQCLMGQENSLLQLAPSYEEAAFSSGYTPRQTFLKVTIPLIKNGILGGWIMVFVNVTKELPVTLLLRPAGFDTMAVRIWIDASEGFYTSAAPLALVLISITMVTLKSLMDK